MSTIEIQPVTAKRGVEIDRRVLGPISILTLLIWTTLTALLCTYRMQSPLEMNGTRGYSANAGDLSLVLAKSIVEAAILSGGFFLLPFAITRGQRLRLAPGHWLMLGLGAIVVLREFSVLLAFSQGRRYWNDALVFGIGLPIAAMTALMAACAVAHLPRLQLWPIYFSALLILSLCFFAQAAEFLLMETAFPMNSVGMLILFGNLTGLTTVLITFPAAVLTDFLRGRRYDWAHYGGLTSFVLLPTINLIAMP